ncbi:hypothetical protein PR202_gb22800 [Eleusine coracana subsp. coracana]|uniref:Uncharacterized protein n=1 Tax=Eleusine coracana subsp. coracana TaxID=191504 RepID=A0AAV5FGR5_ELECO|nr:hypothetical protein PR202_gb22800 [Eleusine coracana subsp. coracana]
MRINLPEEVAVGFSGSIGQAAELHKLMSRSFDLMLQAVPANKTASSPRQTRYCPKGFRYPKKTLKEHLRYVPDSALVIDFVTSAPTPMESSTSADWKGKVITCLAWNDLDVALRVDKPTPPADGVAPSAAFEKWERSDRMATMVML